MSKTVEAYGILDPQGELVPTAGHSKDFFWILINALGISNGTEKEIKKKLIKAGYKISKIKIETIDK